MAAQTFTRSGRKATNSAKLDKKVFNVVPVNHDLLKAAYLAYLANRRANLAKVKTRGDVSGGGKKPWRQKGTGRARVGSSRVPHWRGGGAVFGPTGQESFTIHLSGRSRLLALRQALSLAAAKNRILVIESLQNKEGTTKSVIDLLTKLGAERNVLLILEQRIPMLMRATRNIADVKIVTSSYLNIFDVMNADFLVFEEKALEDTTLRLIPAKKAVHV